MSSVGFAEEIANRVGGGVDVLTGSIAEVLSGDSVAVHVGGNLHPGKLVCAPGYVPFAGDPVLVLRQGSRLDVIGYVGPPLSTTGVVTAIPPPPKTTLVVTVDGLGQAELPYLGTYSPTVGDQVALLWRGGPSSGLVLGDVGDGVDPPLPPAPPPPPPPAPVDGATTFAAVAVGTWRSGAWRTDDNGDVIQGSYAGVSNRGVWFYGGQPRSTLAGATVTGAEIWLGRTSGGVFGAQTCHLYRTGEDWKGSPPSFGAGPHDVSLSVGQTGWFSFPASVAQQIVDLGGSVGIQGEPYMRMFGLSKSGQAGALRIYWRR